MEFKTFKHPEKNSPSQGNIVGNTDPSILGSGGFERGHQGNSQSSSIFSIGGGSKRNLIFLKLDGIKFVNQRKGDYGYKGNIGCKWSHVYENMVDVV